MSICSIMGKIVRSDVSVAKNYLTKSELEDLNQFVSMYLDYAERRRAGISP